MSAASGPDRRDGEVPRLPRGPMLRVSGPQLFRIALVAILLVMVIAMRKPCSDGVAGFVGSFAPPPDAGPTPTAPTMQLERLTDEQIRQRFPAGLDAGAPAAP